MDNIGLVLEGGGMRGVYTAGVLEYFLEEQLHFNYVVGVSAGASNAASYISRQKGRNEIVNIRFVKDWRYLGIRSFIKTKSAFGMDFIFDEIPNKLVPFDFQTFYNSGCKFLIGTTDCKTGKPTYFEKADLDEKFTVLRASCSLPLLSPIVNYKGYELLDGGLSDSIPIKKSIEDGNELNVIVLTRNKGYRKKPTKYIKLFEKKYKNYPLLVETIKNRYIKYNESIDFIEKLEREGKAIVIRPSKPLEVGRMERNPLKLTALLKNGFEDAAMAYDKIINWKNKV